MKTTAPTNAEPGQQAASERVRSRPAWQPAVKPSGHCIQLAAMVNASPRAKALTQMKDSSQQSSPVQSLMGLAAEINQSAAFQRQSQDHNSKDQFVQLMLEPAPKFAYHDPANENGANFLPDSWQPPNNVAQRTTDGEYPAVSVAKDSPKTGVVQMEFTTTTLLALAATAGIAGITYILATYGATYAWIWLKIKISGANPNLSVQQLVQLSNNLPAYSYDDIIRFGGLNLTVVQITQLGALAAVNNDANNVMALGGIGNRTFAEIIQISAMAGIAAPTVQEIVAIAATAFTMVELGQMANLAQINTAAALVQIASIVLPAATILGIAAFPQAPTAAQIATLAATGKTFIELGQLSNLAQINTAAELVQVASIALPAATILGIAGFPQAPSAAQIAALAATNIPLPTLTAIAARPAFVDAPTLLNFLNLQLTQAQNANNKRRLAELDNLPLVNDMEALRATRAFALSGQNGRIVFRFNGGTWANAQADCIAVFGPLGANLVAGTGNAPNGQLRELYSINAHGVVIICRSWSSQAIVLATIEIQAGPRYEFKYE